jgi:glyoxylase-like metal-dependent hydrolase (beta-lactamase superfamily II)
MAHTHRQYYPGLLARIGLEADEYRLSREQELAAQLDRLGYRLREIETVVLTHLHEDHLGELRALLHATVVLSADSWDEQVAFRRLRDVSPSVPQVARSWQLIPYASGPFHSFARSQHLLGDGSIILLPTPGHAAGHLAVLVACGDYQLLLAGDAIYTLRHLAVDQVPALTLGRNAQAQQMASIRRLQQLRQTLPELVLIPTHDHTAYQRDHIAPFLADGTLSPEERQAITDYEARLFDAPWHLPDPALPRFLPATDGGPIGQVSEPEAVAIRRARGCSPAGWV